MVMARVKVSVMGLGLGCCGTPGTRAAATLHECKV